MTLLNFAANQAVRRRSWGAALVAGCLFAGTLAAQDPSSPALPTGPRLTLEDAVSQALGNNLGLQIERLDMVASQATVEAVDASFDTAVTAGIRLGETDADNRGFPVPELDEDGNPVFDAEGRQVVYYNPSSSDARSYSVGARKRLRITNATMQIQTAVSRNAGSTYNSNLGQTVGGRFSEEASVSASITQPLLQGFGREIAEAPLERARAADRATQLTVRDSALDVIERTETAYWSLATAHERLAVRKNNYELARSLLEEMNERERLGLATRLDVIQAEANLAQREDDILVAEQLIQDATDTLRVLIGGLHAEDLLVISDFTVQPLPPPPTVMPDLSTVWQSALHSDNLIASQEEVLLQREIDLRLAQDSLKPELDLTLSGSFSGVSDEDAREALRLVKNRDTTGWGIQLGFEMPLGRRAAQADLRSANARLTQAQWRLQQLKQQLLQEVRTAHRELETRQKRLRSAELVLRLQEETYTQERTKLDEGLSTVRDVLEIQADLDNARLSLLDAQAAVIQAELSLERLRGTLLERHGLDWPTVAPSTLP